MIMESCENAKPQKRGRGLRLKPVALEKNAVYYHTYVVCCGIPFVRLDRFDDGLCKHCFPSLRDVPSCTGFVILSWIVSASVDR